MLSPSETLDVVGAGKLLALGEKINGRYAFSSHALDALRSETVNLISRTVCNELARRGASEDIMLAACSRAFTRQTELACGPVENIIEFDQNASGSFVNGVGTGVGIAAGAAGAYGAYRYLRNRRKNGNHQLPGNGDDGLADAVDVTPKPKVPSGGGVIDAMNSRHPGSPSVPRLNISSTLPNAADDALGSAVKRGRQAIAKRGSAVWRAIRSIPIE